MTMARDETTSAGTAATDTAGRGSRQADGLLHCLAYVPNIYNGGGTTQTLVWIAEHFERANIRTTLCFQRTWKFPRTVASVNLFPSILRRLPGSWTDRLPKYFIERAFLRRLWRQSPDDTFVYLWPEPRPELVEAIKARGFCVFRELINCPGLVCITEVNIARRNAGLNELAVSHQGIDREWRQIQSCDFVTAPNAEVERSLIANGLPRDKIVSTSFGWADERFPHSAPGDDAVPRPDPRDNEQPFTVLFVGHIEARKGVHYLLEAWKELPSSMHLRLVGTVDPDMAPILARALRDDHRIEHVPHTPDLEDIFRSADVFAFPSVEEGGPQVTFEAAGCGLPVVTTPMGAARLIVDGANGRIVPPHDVPALRAALLELYEQPDKRREFARQAQRDAQAFTYRQVGESRARLFRQKFAEFLAGARA